MATLKQQHQRPEGRLLDQAMKRPPKTSGRELARAVGLSEGRIRQIVNGYKSEGGVVIPVVGPADTVARIATALGLRPEHLREAGREDAADEMSPLRTVSVTEQGDLWVTDDGHRLAQLRVWLDEAETGEPGPPPPIGVLSLWDFEQLMEAAVARHIDELRLKDYLIELFGKRQTSSPLAPDPLADPDAPDLRGGVREAMEEAKEADAPQSSPESQSGAGA